MLKSIGKGAGRWGNDERGSVVVALGVLLVLSTLSLGLLARTLSTLRSVRSTQDFSAALAVADSGLSDAVYRLDQAATASFTVDGTTAGGSYHYAAQRISNTEYLVQSRGTVNGVRHAVEVRLTRSTEYPYALFTDQTLDVNGNNYENIFSYDATSGLTNTGNALVGSNGEVQVNGGGRMGDGQHWFLACNGCAAPVQLDRRRDLPAPVMPAVGDSQVCPTGNVFNGTIDGLGGRPFRCTPGTGRVDFGTVTVTNGPLVIYVQCSGNGATTCVDLEDASVNTGTGKKAKDFQLYLAGTGAISLAGTNYTGLVYAPDANSRINGKGMRGNGSLTLDSLRVNGQKLNLAYEDSVQDVALSRWTVRDYTEIPSGSVP